MAVAELLRATRQRRGLTLEQLANETKIRLDRLAAFECEERPPDGSFYARARLRAYAQALGLDYRVVLEQLNQEIRAASPPVVPEPPAPPAPRFEPLHLALPVACVVLILMIVSVWFKPNPPHARAASRVRPAPISNPTPPPAQPIVDRAVSVAIVPAAFVPATVTNPTIGEHQVVPVGTSGVLPRPAATSLVITSTPDGARVTVDGIGWGTTPVTIPHLPQGHKRIRVTSDGYAAVERLFDVQSDRQNIVALQLEPLE